MQVVDTILAFFSEHILAASIVLVTVFIAAIAAINAFRFNRSHSDSRSNNALQRPESLRDDHPKATSPNTEPEIFYSKCLARDVEVMKVQIDVTPFLTHPQLELDLKYLATVTPPAKKDYKAELGYTPVELLYATSRTPVKSDERRVIYGSDRSDELRFGIACVSIPKRHLPGHIERPRWMLFQFRDDPSKFVSILSVNEKKADEWVSILRSSLSDVPKRSVLLFVHGYNVTFDEAARRAAQLVYDLAFDGIPVLYSWPSTGSILGYTADEATVEWAAGHLQELLKRVASARPDEINAIAHSMGNRALTTAISRFAEQWADIHLNQVVLAAPDIDAKFFVDYLAPRLRWLSQRASIYASSGDQALVASETVHAFSRVGQGSPDLVLASGIDTIDASPIDTDLLGHGYFAENKQVIDDLFMLIRHGLPPESRNLRKQSSRGLPYWVFP